MGISERLAAMKAKQEAGDTNKAEETAKAEAERAKAEAEAAKAEQLGELQTEREAVMTELSNAEAEAGAADEAIAEAEAFAESQGENLDPQAAAEIDAIKAEAGEAKQKYDGLKAEVARIDSQLEGLEEGEEEQESEEGQEDEKGFANAKKLLSTDKLGTKASPGPGGGALEMNYSKSNEDRSQFKQRAEAMVKDKAKTEEFLDLYQSDEAIAEEYPRDSLDKLQIEMAKLVRPDANNIDSIAADWALGRDYDKFMDDWEKKAEDGADTSEMAGKIKDMLTDVEGEIESVSEQVDKLNDAVGLTVAIDYSSYRDGVNVVPSQNALLKRKRTLLKAKRMIDTFLPEQTESAEAA